MTPEVPVQRWAAQRTVRRNRLSSACDASLARRGRIEDHSLLADFHFAVLEAARAFVHMQDGTGSRLLRLDKLEAARNCA